MTFIDRLKALFGGTSTNGESAGPEMISCHEALTLVHEFLDGELDDMPRSQVEAHFEVCQRCYPHLKLERTFREALGRATRAQAAPPELREAVLQALSRDTGESGEGDARG